LAIVFAGIDLDKNTERRVCRGVAPHGVDESGKPALMCQHVARARMRKRIARASVLHRGPQHAHAASMTGCRLSVCGLARLAAEPADACWGATTG
jgi:hypothetical protein